MRHTRFFGPIVALVLLATGSYAQAFHAQYDFTGKPGDQLTTAPTSGVPSGLTLSTITRGSGVTASALGNAMSSRSWTTLGQTDPNDYYALAVTPDPGKTVSLTTLQARMRRSNTGPRQGALRSSADGFASDLFSFLIPTIDTSPLSFDLSTLTALQNVGGTMELRLYGYGASSSAGTFALTSPSTGTGVDLFGSMKSLPPAPTPTAAASEPTTLALAFLGVGLVWVRRAKAQRRHDTLCVAASRGRTLCERRRLLCRNPLLPSLAAPTSVNPPSSTA